MTHDAYSYDFDALAVAHEDITDTARELDRIRDEIERGLGRLRTAWSEGAAATAAYAYHSEWLAIFADVVTELHNLSNAVELSRRNALAVETANRAMWNA